MLLINSIKSSKCKKTELLSLDDDKFSIFLSTDIRIALNLVQIESIEKLDHSIVDEVTTDQH